jgi:hypothetical protein
MATITERESQQIEQANSDGRTPLVFIHGLWLLPSSWDRWADLFEEAAGYGPVTPVWPDDPDTVEQARLPVLGHPFTRGRAVTLTLDQFQVQVGDSGSPGHFLQALCEDDSRGSLDQCEVRKGLRKVPEVSAGLGVELLRIQPERGCGLHEAVHQVSCPLRLADDRQRRDQPEGADEKAPLLAG